MRDRNQLWSLTEALSSGSLATSLGHASTIMSSVVTWAKEHLGIIKNSSDNGSTESSILSRTYG